MKYVKVEVMDVEGRIILVNDSRVAGLKAWSGGKILYTWVARRDELLDAIGKHKCIEADSLIEACHTASRSK